MSIKKFTLKLFVYTSILIGILAPISGFIQPQIEYIDRPVPVRAQPRAVHEIIAAASQRSGVPAILIRAIIEQESAGDTTAVKFEPHHLSRVPARIGHPDKRRMYASSIGLMQVMAWHLFTLLPDRDYTALFDPEVNIAVGTRILSDCMKRHSGKPPTQQYRLALTCYNGSDIYAEEVLERVGVLALTS
jgi:soluble lytic murein transglycosylase-like protein